MKRSDEKRQERAKLVEEARGILDLAENEKRDLTAEENEKYDRIEADIDKFGDEIEAEERDEQRRKHLAEFGEERTGGSVILKPEPEGSAGAVEPKDTPEYREIFRGIIGATIPGMLAIYQMRALKTYEDRALQMDADTAGGYTVMPQLFLAELIEAVRNQTIMRGLSTVRSVPKAESLGAPALDNRPGDPTWTGEILTGDEDSTMSFGKRELYPHPIARRIRVSKKLLRASALNVEEIVRDQLAYKIAVVEENAFLNGSGDNQPLGVFTASDDGISTGRDVSTDNTTTAMTPEGLMEAKYTLKSNYWGSSRWIFHRDGVKQIRKMKDGEGQYIWKPGLANDRGDMILDIPVLMSEYAPNTFTASKYVGIVGDFKRYWIADALDATIQVLVELYALTNQNAYIIRKEVDGMPVLEEAFIRVKLAAS